MPKADHVHVAPNGTRWRISQRGRTLSTHRTQRTAVAVGMRVARRSGVDLVTHGRDGRIRSKDTYGREGSVKDLEH